MMKLKLICAAMAALIFSIGTVAAQTRGGSAESAAKTLYSAWKTKDRKKARSVADAKAVNKLFGTRFQPTWKFSGCNDESETQKGLMQCIFRDADDAILSVAFDTFKSGRSWRIRWLTFGAEN